MQKVLVIEDDEDISELISNNLRRNGHIAAQAFDGFEGLEKAGELLPDLIILDIMMPGKDGFEVFRELKKNERTEHIPVLFLSARAQLEDRLTGLSLGADDYITKPFSPKELMLRVQNTLKRSAPKPARLELECGPFLLDKNTLKCRVDGEPVDLTAGEFKLLAYLIERAGTVQTRGDIMRHVWGYSDDAQSRTLDTHIKRLRQKIAPHAGMVETVRGTGYLFRLPEE